jgi:hypothetical protein
VDRGDREDAHGAQFEQCARRWIGGIGGLQHPPVLVSG